MPTEGLLDVDSWLRLTELLASHSIDGARTECLAYFTPWTSRNQLVRFLLRGRLENAADLIDQPDRVGSLQSLWPTDRSWFVFTDYDLWASRVSGTTELINDLVAEDVLEAGRLADAPMPKPHGTNRPDREKPDPPHQ